MRHSSTGTAKLRLTARLRRVMTTKTEIPCGGCSTDPCYHWPYCTELLSLRAERDAYQAAQTKIDRLLELLDEIKSCGHWSDCPAGANEKYRCRCAYGILVEAEPW